MDRLPVNLLTLVIELLTPLEIFRTVSLISKTFNTIVQKECLIVWGEVCLDTTVSVVAFLKYIQNHPNIRWNIGECMFIPISWIRLLPFVNLGVYISDLVNEELGFEAKAQQGPTKLMLDLPELYWKVEIPPLPELTQLQLNITMGPSSMVEKLSREKFPKLEHVRLMTNDRYPSLELLVGLRHLRQLRLYLYGVRSQDLVSVLDIFSPHLECFYLDVTEVKDAAIYNREMVPRCWPRLHSYSGPVDLAKPSLKDRSFITLGCTTEDVSISSLVRYFSDGVRSVINLNLPEMEEPYQDLTQWFDCVKAIKSKKLTVCTKDVQLGLKTLHYCPSLLQLVWMRPQRKISGCVFEGDPYTTIVRNLARAAMYVLQGMRLLSPGDGFGSDWDSCSSILNTVCGYANL